jgi:hypothetical protein
MKGWRFDIDALARAETDPNHDPYRAVGRMLREHLDRDRPAVTRRVQAPASGRIDAASGVDEGRASADDHDASA